MVITHTLEECKEMWKCQQDIKCLENVLSNFHGVPITFSEMSRLGVPSQIIYFLFLVSKKVPNNLKKQLANYNCQLAPEYCKKPENIKPHNEPANGHSAAWQTGAYLHRSVFFSGDCSRLLAEIFNRQVAYICKICDGETPEEEAA